MVKLYYEPQVTLLSNPTFHEPEHIDVEWLGESTDGERLAEFAGRSCYQSFHNPAGRTTSDYLENIKDKAHGSVFEHANYSLLFEGVSRSLSHELVRHRAGFAYSQLSQRYVDESDVGFVVPVAMIGNPVLEGQYSAACAFALDQYKDLVDELMEQYAFIADKTERRKKAREAAREVLPNGTETKIVVTGNVRAWRHFFFMRGALGADAQIARLAIMAFDVLSDVAPLFFSDFEMHQEPKTNRLYLTTKYPKV